MTYTLKIVLFYAFQEPECGSYGTREEADLEARRMIKEGVRIGDVLYSPNFIKSIITMEVPE